MIDLFGIRSRADNKHLRRLAASRAERINTVTRLNEAHAHNIAYLIRRYSDLMAIVAMHYTAGTSLDQLRAALHGAGFAADLDMALRDLHSEEATA